MSSPTGIILLASCAFFSCSALSIQHYTCTSRSSWTLTHHRRRHSYFTQCHQHHHLTNSNKRQSSSTALRSTTDEDETLLESVDISTLQNLCLQYSLSTSGTKHELLSRLRQYANDQAEQDRMRYEGRKRRVEDNLDGKARHTFIDEPWIGADNDEEEGGYFYYDVGETDDEKKKQQEREEKMKLKQQSASKSNHITAPNPKDIVPNEKGERVVTIYSTTDNNDLTGMQSPSLSMDEMGHKPISNIEETPEDSLIGGPFGDTSGSKRKKDQEEELESAKEKLRILVGDLLATTGAPAFQDDYQEEEDDDEDNEMMNNSYTTPYGFVGFQSERIPSDTLLDSSYFMRIQNGKALHEILEEYEMQAIGHDGMAADDIDKGGGHYREVQKVRSFLDGFRKSEERRVARETCTLLLDRLVKEGVVGLDQLLASMPKENDDTSRMLGVGAGNEAGVLNSALIRYLDEAIREQEQRVERIQTRRKHDVLDTDNSLDDENDDLLWNVTRGEDGTIIETVDLNDPALRDELTKANARSMQSKENYLSSLTVQEKMLLLLNLLRERVKVEAIMGSHDQAKNLRVLAYCLKAGDKEERRKFILDELGSSLDALDMFADLVRSSVDFAEARSNDDFMPGTSKKAVVSPLLNLSKLKAVQELVNEIKMTQQWKASGVGSKSKPPIDVKDLTNMNIEDFM